MADKNQRKIIPAAGGFIGDIALRVKLIARLMGDARVSPLAKLLPIGTLIYLIVPDLIPTPIDDAMLMWLGGYLFVELCPPYVVDEHLLALTGRSAQELEQERQGGDDIIDAEYWEEK
jgi:hypothetical protein